MANGKSQNQNDAENTSSEAMPNSSSSLKSVVHELSAAKLAKTIFKAEVPEQLIREFSAQSLFLTIKYNGLESCADLIRMASPEQCSLFLDFDLWEHDSLNEDRLWQWLELTEEDDSIGLMQKLLKVIDLKLITLLITRHIDVVASADPTDHPPGPGYYTPDKGMTWIGIQIEDGTKHLLMGKLLALIFESNPRLFYQLLAIPGTHTPSMLEEDSFIEKQRRLSAEGIPDLEYAGKIHAPISEKDLLEALKKTSQELRPRIEDIRPVEPFIYEKAELQPFSQLAIEAAVSDDFQAELTLIMNAALVFFSVDLGDVDAVLSLTAKVRGSINIGLERLIESTSLSVDEIYKKCGLQALYRLGLSHLRNLRSALRGIQIEMTESESSEERSITIDPNTAVSVALEGVRKPFPEMLQGLQLDGRIADEEGHISSRMKPFEHVEELAAVRKLFKAGSR